VEHLLGARLAGGAQPVQPSEVALRCGARLGEAQLGCPPPLPLPPPPVLLTSFSNMFTFAATAGRTTYLRGYVAGWFVQAGTADADAVAEVLDVRDVIEVTVAKSSDDTGSLLLAL
jgi:hypothetical protein